MMRRKPVQSQSANLPTPSTTPTPLLPNRPPPEPPVPSSSEPADPLEQVEYDSDFDWDACDEEEPEVAPSEPILASATSEPNVEKSPGTTPLPVQTAGSTPRPMESQQTNISADLNPSSPGPRPFDPVRARSTNPFLRTEVSKQPSKDPKPSPNMWNDERPLARVMTSPTDYSRSAVYEQPSTALPEATVYPGLEGVKRANVVSSKDGASTPTTAGAARSLASPPNVTTALHVQGPEKNETTSELKQKSYPPAGPTADLEEPQSSVKKQRNEFYQIKHIRWYDGTSKENPRNSPILIQNANGPCPLLALVNCLVLSTPSNLSTALIETLRKREQVSLGLLLDAVFDELTSERRCSSVDKLPDVAELYSFLITLHTGMNVNPRFVSGPNLKKVPSGADEATPGSFEDTKEMNLYGTFSIPLIHGWLPHRNETAFEAFERAAQTYEDAQNLQFLEEDLEEKLRSDQLTPEEQQLLTDLKVIKQFLFYWPTQLTAHGLDVIDRFLKPGSFCILFRNDHFSTVLKEPYSNRLMTLVTDAGYSTHAEIIWESLVDINGANSEFCSGDFRSVSHHGQEEAAEGIQLHDDEGWTTVESKNGRGRRPAAASNSSGKRPASPEQLKPQSHGFLPEKTRERTLLEPGPDFDIPDRSQRVRSASEQEDHDLALALQLQEEEEERERNEAATRRARENDLSEEFLSRESSRQGGPVRIPVRRSGQSQNNPTPAQVPTPAYAPAASRTPASARPPPIDTSGNDVAPPPYEQAAAAVPFYPPRNHPASEHAPRSPLTSSTQTASAYGMTSGQPLRNGAGPAPTAQRRMSARQSLAEQQTSPQAGGMVTNRRPRMETGLTPVYAGKDSNDKCLMM